MHTFIVASERSKNKLLINAQKARLLVESVYSLVPSIGYRSKAIYNLVPSIGYRSKAISHEKGVDEKEKPMTTGNVTLIVIIVITPSYIIT